VSLCADVGSIAVRDLCINWQRALCILPCVLVVLVVCIEFINNVMYTQITTGLSICCCISLSITFVYYYNFLLRAASSRMLGLRFGVKALLLLRLVVGVVGLATAVKLT
jgi:fucose permease